jgi:acyl phosphate:glycerol-3-phosphate acyltransferase
MQAWQFAAIWIGLAFFCGSVPCGWLAARGSGIDLRTVGSGNIGGTNAWRALGWRWGLAVLLADMLKGLLPLVALRLCLGAGGGGGLAIAWQAPLLQLTALAAVLGHTFTPWLKFKGGKGAATGLGVVAALFGLWALIPAGIFGLTLALTRYVSLGSILAALSAPLCTLLIAPLRPYWPLTVLAAALIIFAHRSNIQRLLAGTESRVGRKA